MPRFGDRNEKLNPASGAHAAVDGVHRAVIIARADPRYRRLAELPEPPAVASLFVLSLNESEFRLCSGLAIEECEDCCFRAGHVASPTDAIATDQFINDGRRDSMLGEREDTIARATLINHQEINVAVSIVKMVAVSSDLHDSARSRGGFATDITVGRTRILTGEVIAGDCGCSHVGSFQC
jgi:hypothetical protein